MGHEQSNADFEALINAEYPEEATGPVVTRITPEMMLKRLIWDIVPCATAAEVAAQTGLHPASPDVEDTEHHQSHERLVQVYALTPFLNDFAIHAAKAVRGAMIVGSEDVDPQDEDKVLDVEVLAALVYQTSIAIIAELNDIGAIHLPHTTIFEVDDSE